MTEKKEVIEHYDAQLTWVDGKPTVTAKAKPFGPKDAAPNLQALMKEALNLPYTGTDPRFKGLTKGEAMTLQLVEQASEGDKEARKEILDRVLGKAVQNVKSLKLEANMADFLDNIPDDHNPDQNTVDAQDAEILDI